MQALKIRVGHHVPSESRQKPKGDRRVASQITRVTVLVGCRVLSPTFFAMALMYGKEKDADYEIGV